METISKHALLICPFMLNKSSLSEHSDLEEGDESSHYLIVSKFGVTFGPYLDTFHVVFVKSNRYSRFKIFDFSFMIFIKNHQKC